MTSARLALLWLIGVVVVFTTTTTTISVMVGLFFVTATWLLVMLSGLYVRAGRTAAAQRRLRTLSFRPEAVRGAKAADHFLEIVGGGGSLVGWSEVELQPRAEAPHLLIRTRGDERVAMLAVNSDPIVPSVAQMSVWIDPWATAEWTRLGAEALSWATRLTCRNHGTLGVHLPSGGALSAITPEGFVERGRYQRRTATGEREEMRYLTLTVGRWSKGWRRRRSHRRRVASATAKMGEAYRFAVPLGVVPCGTFVVRPMTRFDSGGVASILDESMVPVGRMPGAFATARRTTAILIANGHLNHLFVVSAAEEAIIGWCRVDRMVTDARSVAVRVELAERARGGGSELSIVLAVSDRLRSLDVDFVLVPVAADHGLDAATLSGHGFLAVGDRPDWTPRGGWSTTPWFELDVRSAERTAAPEVRVTGM